MHRRQAVTWETHEVAQRVEAVVLGGRAPGLHGLVVIKGGEIIYERYGSGEDFTWNESVGVVEFGPDTLHDIRSVTKSVTGLVYGIALGKGLVPEPQESLLGQFPEYPDLAREKAGLTIEHAMTMTLGLEWNEDVPYTSTDNSELAMEAADDRYRYILERPIVEEPGRTWRYCGGAAALIGRIIAKGAGVPLDAFAREHLLEPLGITASEWMAGDDGDPSAASGLRLTARGLAEIGQLVLDGGRGIVPSEWIDRMLTPRVGDYGYQWYVGTGDTRWYGAFGNGGQRVYVEPGRDLVFAITAGDYNDSDQPAANAVHEAIGAALVK
ncbi:beta-lactamase family protein [Nonomuraea sp. NBC_01738]|uniref:serine hydrolase domain-containing protein n=1 Tax=Nonomuraea sp. NBC_01738 TaxID=2976003 RepID=UPI002E13EA81|nr:beta-lactamase family protein [Nonomuraea sp. NBC_01738]